MVYSNELLDQHKCANSPSPNHETPKCLYIKNTTSRKVYLFWTDSDGNLVKYGHVWPGMYIQITTHLFHLWTAKDAKTGLTLCLNGRSAFLPACRCHAGHYSDRNKQPVTVTLPVFNLLDRCLETVRLNIPRGVWSNENIPRVVRAMLYRTTEPSRYIDYHELSPTICDDLGG